MSRKGSQYVQRKCSFQVAVAQGMDNDPEVMLDNTNTDNEESTPSSSKHHNSSNNNERRKNPGVN